MNRALYEPLARASGLATRCLAVQPTQEAIAYLPGADALTPPSSGHPFIPMDMAVTVEPLAAHREALPLLEEWFRQEWPSYYGSDGPGDARRDLQSFANLGSLPIGVLAALKLHL